ncbi:MAG: hypothetical protein QXD25_01125 [Nanopusillaceae archaeon]
MNNYLLRISYNGEKFHGVVPQKNVKTVLNEIINFYKIDKYRYSIVSRTDKGVSAKENYLVLQTEKDIDFTTFFHNDIKILNAFKLKEYINIRKFSTGKKYIYRLPKSLFEKFYRPKWIIFENKKIEISSIESKFDIKKYIEASKYFIGEKSFHNFAKGKVKNSICKIIKFEIYEEEDFYINIIEGNRFLYEMIRRIITFLISVGKNLYPLDKINLVFLGNLEPKPFPADSKYLLLEKVYLDWKKLYRYIEKIII